MGVKGLSTTTAQKVHVLRFALVNSRRLRRHPIAKQPIAQQPEQPTARAKPTAPGPRAKGLKDQGLKGSRTKKGAWGRGTARTQTDAGADAARAVAEPEGGAGAAGTV